MYGVKYTTSYKRLSNSLTTIDILEEDYSGATTELIADGDPLAITTGGDVKNIYKSTIGSGATIKLFVTPLAFLDLFTNDPQKYKVKIYDGNRDTGTLIWQGFVNAEIYTENYSYPDTIDIPITLQCNDGMKLLENILYKESNGDYYTGTVTLATVIGNILDKLGITFTTIYSNNDLEAYYPGDYCNLFQHLKIPSENFIDESGDAMSCRAVLDSIFDGLGLVWSFKGDNIYLIDPINLHDTGTGKSYSASGFNNEQTATGFGGYLDISEDEIDWFKTNMILDIVPQVDEIKVKYNPYNYNEAEYNFSDSTNWSASGTWVDATGYYYNTGVEYIGWEETGVIEDYMFRGTKEEIDSTPEYIMLLLDLENKARYTFPLSNITQDGNIRLKISMDVYVQTRETTINIWTDSTSHNIYQVKIPISIKVGDQFWKYTNSWATGETGNYIHPLIVREEGVSEYDVADSRINDRWTNASIDIPLGISAEANLIHGDISIIIHDELKTWVANQILPTANEGEVHLLLFKNVKVEVINVSTGENVGNDGIEKNAIISTNLTGKKEFVINTTTGTGPYGCSKGAFKTAVELAPITGSNILGLYRDSDLGTIYSTEDFTLQSFISQYKQPRFKLAGSLDVVDHLLVVDKKLIQNLTHLPDKSFYIANSTYNDRDEAMNVQMIELTSTRDTIA